MDNHTKLKTLKRLSTFKIGKDGKFIKRNKMRRNQYINLSNALGIRGELDLSDYPIDIMEKE